MSYHLIWTMNKNELYSFLGVFWTIMYGVGLSHQMLFFVFGSDLQRVELPPKDARSGSGAAARVIIRATGSSSVRGVLSRLEYGMVLVVIE